MANLLEKGYKWLIKHELINNIKNGDVAYLSFPKEMEKWLVTKRVDYIEMALKQGYIIDISTPDYIKNNPKYTDLFIKIIRHRIKDEEYCDLYNIPGEILDKIGINYIKKALDNVVSLQKDIKKCIPVHVLNNAECLIYLVNKKTENISLLNGGEIKNSTLNEISKNSQLMCSYIDIVIKQGKSASFVGELNVNYILYYINRSKTIGDNLTHVTSEKWRQIYSINPGIMETALAKGMYYDELSEDVIDIFESQLIKQCFYDIMNKKYRYLGLLPDTLLKKIASNPEYLRSIIKDGQIEIIWYAEYKAEYLRLIIEEYLDESELKEINETTGKNYKDYNELLSVNENFNMLFFEYIKDKISSLEDNQGDAWFDYEEAKENFQNTKNKFLKFLKITRINGVNISYETLMKMPDELLSKYKTKVVNNLMQNKFLSTNQETIDATFSIIGMFGLFDDDRIASNTRFNKINSVLRKMPDKISEDEYKELLDHFSAQKSLIEECFEKTEAKKYTKKQGQPIPACLEIYSTYFTDELTEGQYKFLKKLLPKGTICRELTDYLRNTYEEVQCTNYRLKNNASQAKHDEIRDMMQQIDVEGMLTVESLHMIFSGCKQTYSEEFYQFIIDNIDKILIDKKNQRNIWSIQRNFDTIKKENVGQKVSYAKAIEYVNKPNYGDIKDTRFIQELKKAGVTSASAAQYYLNLHEISSQIKATSLPPYEKEYIEKINGETIKFRARRLDKRDPLLVLVGEKEYTNCCQSYAQPGQKCNEHSAKSEDGGVFVTEVFLNGKWILLTQSWDWVNNNVYCHDNIEATKTAKKYKDTIAKMYSDHAKHVIEISKKTIEQYIESNNLDTEHLRQAKRQIITLVTVGTSFNDIGVHKYFKRKVRSTIGPIGYKGYRDSHFQLIIEGTEQFVESKIQTGTLHLFKEKAIVKKHKISEVWNTLEKNKILEILLKNGQNIDDYYSEKTSVIYTDNWVIIYKVEKENFMIDNIVFLGESEQYKSEALDALRELAKILPLETTSNQVQSSDIYKLVSSEQNSTEQIRMTNKTN